MSSVRTDARAADEAARALGTSRLIQPGPNSAQLGRVLARWSTRFALFRMGPPAGLTHAQDPIRRTRLCGRVALSYNVGVEVERHGARLPRFSGLLACGAIHACPVCSANIRHQRALEVEQAALAHLAAGGVLVMLTLTVPHHRGMPLDDLWSLISRGWNACASGRGGREDRDRWGRIGYVRAIETTYGGNGWHPHLHVLLFLAPGDRDRVAAEVEQAWFDRWRGFVTGRGWQAPTRAHGVDARAVTSSDVGEYLVKVQDGSAPAGTHGWGPAQELARADLKRGRVGSRTPFALVDEWSLTGSTEALAAWREWERSSKGRRVLTWSRGLKDRYGVGEVADSVAAERKQWEADALYLLCPDEWAVVLDAGAETQLLEVAGMHGRDGVVELLRELFALDGDQTLSCDQCERNSDGLRTRPCDACGAMLRAVSGRADDGR